MSTLRVTTDPLLRRLRLFSAADRTITHAEGVCIAVCDAPTVTIETDSGEKVHWRADLTEATSEPLSEVALQRFRDSQRPLVVIDPDSPEDVDRLTKVIVEACYRDGNTTVSDNGIHADSTQAALREFAKPTPPKPDEPTGLGAVVEDVHGNRWISHRHSEVHEQPWVKHMSGNQEWADWSDVPAVRVLSEGVPND